MDKECSGDSEKFCSLLAAGIEVIAGNDAMSVLPMRLCNRDNTTISIKLNLSLLSWYQSSQYTGIFTNSSENPQSTKIL